MNKLISTLILTLLVSASPVLAQWSPEKTIVLKGKVVSMHKEIKNGRVVIRDGKVVAIVPSTAGPIPGAIEIETDGFIYPGLMNLHNHMAYNFLPLLDVPERYDNRYEWPSGKAYERYVNDPKTYVTKPDYYDLMEEALKYAEVRAIVGGETAVQGAENRSAISSTLVRNVELENFGRDNVGQNTLGMQSRFYQELDEGGRESIVSLDAWFYHLAEGIDELSRREWSAPDFDPAEKFTTRKSDPNVPGLVEAGLVWPGLVGIHCTGLKEADFAEWKQMTGEGPKIVWSPTSNLLLYGETTDIRAALKHDATIALGTDWSPSGTRNLLWELKVVAELNREANPPIFASNREIVELVTVNPAKILKWEDTVGQIRAGYVADLLVIDAIPGAEDGYENLIMATEANVQLVMVGGNPLYGDERHMERLKTYEGQPRYEILPDSPAGRTKAIDMQEDTSVPKGDLSLAEVRERLLRAIELDPADLADEFDERENYREKNRKYLIRKLEKDDEEVPSSLARVDSHWSDEDVELLIEYKFPHSHTSDRLDPLFTDAHELELIEEVIARQVSTPEAGLDLQAWLQDPTQPASGMLQGLDALDH